MRWIDTHTHTHTHKQRGKKEKEYLLFFTSVPEVTLAEPNTAKSIVCSLYNPQDSVEKRIPNTLQPLHSLLCMPIDSPKYDIHTSHIRRIWTMVEDSTSSNKE